MTNPDGTSSASHNKSAETRFANTLAQGQRQTMPFNRAAQQSIKNQRSVQNPGSPVTQQAVPQINPTGVGFESAPVGNPVNSIDSNIQPEVSSQEQSIESIIAKIRQEQFINSPQVKDAMTSIRLKNIFNSTNPNVKPDSRDLMARIKARVQP